MRQADVFYNGVPAGVLREEEKNRRYSFEYLENYSGPPISLTLPKEKRFFTFDSFPAFFEGFLPEGAQLESLLRLAKLDRADFFGQLTTVGKDLVGAVTVEAKP